MLDCIGGHNRGERGSVGASCKLEGKGYLLSASEMREGVRIHEEPMPERAQTERAFEGARESPMKAGQPASKVHSARGGCVDRDIFSPSKEEYLKEFPESYEPLNENYSVVCQEGGWDQIPALVAGVRDLVAVLATNTSATATGSASEAFGVVEAARRLGCSTKTVHKLCREKRLAFHWVGNRRRFQPEDVSRFVEAQTETTENQMPSGVDDKRGYRLRFSGNFTAGRRKKGGAKGSTEGESKRTEAEILASIRERMREWD
jgi:excisionase family DNA binding protein